MKKIFSILIGLLLTVLFVTNAKATPVNFSVDSITADCNGTGQVTYTGTIPSGGIVLTLYDKHLGDAGAFIISDPVVSTIITSGTSPVSYSLDLSGWTGGPHYRVDSNYNTKSASLDCGTLTPTPTPTVVTPTPTTDPGHHYACVENACTLVNGAGDNTCSSNNDCGEPTPTPTETVTPTPTNTPNNPGGPGDGRSDGGSSCPSCTQAPKAPIQAVLGLSTTSGNENLSLILVQLFGALALGGLGFKLFRNG